ncbi:MAG: hypothetical protein KDC35_18825 [Acidobacteria bacterium]|nr:hypothetical protein [Acidobacteriota bacterium]
MMKSLVFCVLWIVPLGAQDPNLPPSMLKNIWWNQQAGQDLGLTPNVRAEMDQRLRTFFETRVSLNQEVLAKRTQLEAHLKKGAFEDAEKVAQQMAELAARLNANQEWLRRTVIQMLSSGQRALLAEKYEHLYRQNWVVFSKRPKRS